jgi:membrane protein
MLPYHPKHWWPLLRETYAEWTENKAPRLGAALAFYTALSMAPLIVLSLRLAAAFFGDDAARGEIERQTQAMIGEQGSEAIQSIIKSSEENKTAGGIATVLSLVTLLFGASGVFGQLQDSLNTIWEVEPKPGRGIWGVLRDRFLSFAMVMGIAFLLLVSLIISASLAFFGGFLDRLPEQFHVLAQVINALVSFSVITVLFAMTFKFVPDVKMAWRDVWLGAAITAALFTAGKFAIGAYLGHSSMASSYGAAGSFIVLLVWVYYSAQIVFFGAEFTKVYANRFGSRVVPEDHAVPVTQEAQAKAGDKQMASGAAAVPATVPAVRRFFEAWNRHDALAVVATMHPSARYFGPTLPSDGISVVEFLREIEHTIAALPNLKVDHELLGTRDDEHFVRFDLSAEPGSDPVLSGCNLFRVIDDGISSIHAYYDPTPIQLAIQHGVSVGD